MKDLHIKIINFLFVTYLFNRSTSQPLGALESGGVLANKSKSFVTISGI